LSRSPDRLIESVTVAPGKRRSVVLWFTATAAALADTKLALHSLQTTAALSHEQCEALALLGAPRIYRGKVAFACYDAADRRLDQYSLSVKFGAKASASVFTASTSLVDFGDCDVGTRKHASFEVKNHSARRIDVEV
jgi:hypothetical protein